MTTTDFMAAMNHTADRTPESDRRAIIALLRERARIEREQDEQRAWFESIRGVYHEEEAIRASTLAKIEETIQEIASDLRVDGTQHVDIPGVARIAFRTTAEYLRVADPAAFMEWCKANERGELIIETVKESVDTNAAKEIAAEARAETGECLPGIELVAEKVSMKIESRNQG